MLIDGTMQKNYTHLEESLGLGLKRGPLLEYMFRSQASSDGWHLRNTFCSILATVRAVCLKIVTFKTNQRSPTASRDGAGRSGCLEHLKCGDILLTQWPVSNKPRSLNGNAWLECLLAHQSDEHLWRYFFPRKGTSLKEMSRCQPENIANQKTSWRSPDPWLMSFQLNTWNSRPAQGDSETGSTWLRAQNVPSGFRNP